MFSNFLNSVPLQSELRSHITNAYRKPEQECVQYLLEKAVIEEPEKTRQLALKLVQQLKEKTPQGIVQSLMQEFALSSQEGVALMCLAEALLRIPDKKTRDELIRDKIVGGDWKSHLGHSKRLFVNAAAWGLMITGRLVKTKDPEEMSGTLMRLIARGGDPLIRKGVDMAMRMMGSQFVSGQTIEEALKHGQKYEEKGFRYSYDMLGEAAMTEKDAQHYYDLYVMAIHAIGKASAGRGIYEGPGISIKLSAIHPRYSRVKHDRVMKELLPRVTQLCLLAKQYNIGLNIDAEEADRLEISLDLLEGLCANPEFEGWDGIGFVIQAYQKRCPYVIEYLVDLAKRTHHRIMVRLVKGAYWDTEIKRAQVDGLEDYPVYTRKEHTDLSYIACARRLLSEPEYIYPQFATHNAQTLSTIYHLAGKEYYPGQYEFQCLHGMGESLYENVVGSETLGRPCRIYAPVGTHETLLAYLVRRLLENGANTSFVNQVSDDHIDLETLVQSPIDKVKAENPEGLSNTKIVLPRDLYLAQEVTHRVNSAGLDLSNENVLMALDKALKEQGQKQWQALPTVLSGQKVSEDRLQSVINPANSQDIVGYKVHASPEELEIALKQGVIASKAWGETALGTRASMLRKAADLLEEDYFKWIALMVREAGKSYPNAIAEIREAVDFLRYYADQIEKEFDIKANRPLGVILCISPWNFPLAIFMGQVSAALATGNVVLAKPADQTSIIASQAIDVLHQAGIPKDVVQLVCARGSVIGKVLVGHQDINGVMFTGSTEVAQGLAKTLAHRLDAQGRSIPLIAETGGQNAMIVDSSALAEQVVADVLTSAFDSAGQRCSALRVLCLQEDTADHLLEMIKGAMAELYVGEPSKLLTDVGPVIDEASRDAIMAHIDDLRNQGCAITQAQVSADIEKGYFVPPTLIEIQSISQLKKEVFGPVLHVLRYSKDRLLHIVDQINATGYGLTFGIHSRIDHVINQVVDHMHVGNVYVNRNMVGAVVGVQPFGGEGLSGTGPKAGGPLYLYRLLSNGTNGWVGALELDQKIAMSKLLPGPTGEENYYRIKARGSVLLMPATIAGFKQQFKQALQTENRILCYAPEIHSEITAHLTLHQQANIKWIYQDGFIDTGRFDAVLYEGESEGLIQLNQRLANRSGPILIAQGLTTQAIESGQVYPYLGLVHEQSKSINTTAAGGNTYLMTLTEES